jgi:hypothetical protein
VVIGLAATDDVWRKSLASNARGERYMEFKRSMWIAMRNMEYRCSDNNRGAVKADHFQKGTVYIPRPARSLRTMSGMRSESECQVEA